LRRKLTTELEFQGIDDADSVADTLTDMGIYGDVAPFLSVFREDDSAFILEAAYNFSAQRRYSDIILTAVERASKVVFALKSYARFDDSGHKIESDITEGIEVVLTLYHNQLKQGIEVIRRYEEVPPVPCYPDELNQVWTNLIHNAIQSMEGRGILDIAVSLENGRIAVRITDSGGGIPDEIKARIFEPFFTTKPPGEGSGLGLDIVRKNY